MGEETLGIARPRLSLDQARELGRNLYGVEPCGIATLPSERDQNFHLKPDHVLKISSASEELTTLDFENRALQHVAREDPSLPVPRLIPTLEGKLMGETASGRICRLFSYLPGKPLASFKPHSVDLLRTLGRMMGRLDRALAGLAQEAPPRKLKWDTTRAADVLRDGVSLLETDERRGILERHLARFERHVLPRLLELPRGVIHNDGNDHNILIGRSAEITGLLDFGDMIKGAVVCDLAILCAYVMLDKRDPLGAAAAVVAGYHEEHPLGDEELALVFPLSVTRLAMSVSICARQFKDEPEREYLRVSQDPAWRLLERLEGECDRLPHYMFRAACGKDPHPDGAEARRFFQSQSPTSVLPFPLAGGPIHVFDSSAGSKELGGLEVLEDVERFTSRLFSRMKRTGARVGIGRYDEARPLYTSAIFTSAPEGGSEPRTVHLGIDLFVEAGTPIHAPLDGVVHSFRFNDAPLDYGPTIILEHSLGYTLYGHLSSRSLDGLEKKQRIRKGEAFAEVGDFPTNGNWPPHLHFQIILDLLDKEGDFPGVARPSERFLWLGLSPDPGPLLGLETKAEAASNLAAERRQHLSGALSLAYERPLHIVRGSKCFLYDADARLYLDMVNNVAHVGHCHPRVVRAASEQSAVLNTNTRYLHPNILEYARRLKAKLPSSLEVCFFVNSGSEANDLALRLARAHTKRRETLVLDGTYHGNLTSLIEVSPYKFDGPGGDGAADHVTKLPMPDGYRGSHRRADPDYSGRYVEDVRAILEGRPAFVLIAESILSCAGQIVLPPGYLAAVHRLVREAGGVCIADEVQVGFGRVGSHFWAFEAEGVVPDIVTMGKPIGNGHPIGCVVTTREIARSFETGMEYFNTFGGNPVSCAVGLAVLDVIEEEALQENAREMGARLIAGLRELQERFDILGDVRGRGLFLGFELVRDREALEPAAHEARYLVNRMREEGILTSTDGPLENVVKLKPPLVFSDEHAETFLEKLASVLEEDYLAG
ncbi:MAG TPA: aminotransferase class III-fold pyridoxal phosphate-dependent enzyme [Vicinamibacteria bacterium]|nr:aminotransferase class III-fold pyridoxal phosphate-dependent enzyme [Vicinamibacteria bacterium]